MRLWKRVPKDAATFPLQQNRLLGIGLRVGAATSFGIMGAGIKLAAAHGVSLAETAFYRFAFGLPPLLVWIALTGSFGSWRTQRPLAHLWRGILGLSTMVVAFTAVRLLPLAEATTLSFIAPLFSVALSALFLGEQVGPYRWAAVGIGLLGVAVVMQPGGTHLDPLGLSLAGVAGVTITLRQIGRTERTPTIVLWFTCFSMLGTGLFMPFYGQAHDGATWAILLGLGLAGGNGQLFLTYSLR